MKNVSAVFILFTLISVSSFAQSFQKYQKPSRQLSCIWQSSFDKFGLICDYQNYNIRVNPKAKNAIKYMQLYLANKSVGKDFSYPFVWTVNTKNHYLNPGVHKAKVKIVDRCGKVHWIYKNFRVTKCPR